MVNIGSDNDHRRAIGMGGMCHQLLRSLCEAGSVDVESEEAGSGKWWCFFYHLYVAPGFRAHPLINNV